MIKSNLKQFIPPIFLSLLKRQEKKYGFSGEYRSWEEAQKNSSGYENDLILKKTENSALRVKDGKAAFERDSVLFEKPQYIWHLISSLLWIASQNNQSLNVLDFGGSLGTSYFQNKKFFNHLNLNWNIIEQKQVVAIGKKSFENDYLKFHLNINDCVKSFKPDVALLSSSIQYIEKPYDLLTQIIALKIKYIIIDRTPFIEKGQDIITIQQVPPKIYNASFPCWLLNLNKFINIISKYYNTEAEFQQEIDNVQFFRNKKQISFKGFLFKLK